MYFAIRFPKFFFVIMLAFFDLSLPCIVSASAPGNDNFADAYVLTGVSGSTTGTNVEATKEPGEPNHAGFPGGHSVWWSWTAPADGFCVMDTKYVSGLLLGVYTGTTVTALTTVASDYTYLGPMHYCEASFCAQAGVTYRIVLDSLPSDKTGALCLNWDANATPTLTVASSNPDSGTSISVSPLDNGGQGDGTTQFTRSYNFRTTVTLTAPATAEGNVFRKWQIDGADFSGNKNTAAQINMDINHTMTALYAVVNDDFSSAIVISGTTGTVSGTNLNATKEPGEPNHAGNSGGASIWWSWTAPETGIYWFDGVSYSGRPPNPATIRYLAIYTGSRVNALVLQASNNQNYLSLVSLSAQSGVTYKIAVDSNADMVGNINLNWAKVQTLIVASKNPTNAVSIWSYPADRNGNYGNAPTQFTRIFDVNTVVNLQAPATVGGTQTFVKWLKDGYDFTGNTNTAVQVSMDVDHILTAIYSPVLPTLTVTSLNPDSGVAISVSGADFSGLTNGTTQFTRDYNADTTVTLTAPNTANGDTFLKWLKNGAGFEGQENKSILVTVNADTTMTAMYNAATSGPFYVDGAAGSDLNDGLSWATSKRTMQAAINANSNYHQIWVKQGTYVTSLTMRSNVSLYGGFAGTETSLTKRDIKANTTIIDGGTTPSSGNSWATVTLDSVTTVIIDGFTITGGSDHGIACSNADQTNTIINCDIIGNGTSSYGGGINLYSSSLLITSCSISGNDKGGVYASISYADFTNCVISGNKGAGVRHNSWTPYFAYLRFYNCIISGNEGRAMDGGSYSYPDFENCTISRNKAFAALYCFYDHNYTDIYNCIFEGNEGNAIYEDGDSGDFVHAKIINCLFDNGGKDYLEKGGILRRGADNINAVSGNGGNWSGSAMFVMDGPSGTTGTWTAAPAYDPNAYRSALVDAAASFAPNALAGKLITPNVSNLPQLYIVSNSATTMVVVGDARSYTTQGATYKIVDYHLRDGSRALDRGNQSYAPSKDFEGNLRPGSDGKVDIGAYEASAAYQPGTDDGVAPVSSVSSLASLTYTAAFNVAFSAYDDDSGLKEIRLFYRLNGGSWTQYPDAMTTYSISNSPISFNSALTGGDGIYEFYTIATDKAGNVESAPASADSRTHVVSSFSGSRVYVNQNATGLQTGFDWPNALTSISEANSIAIHYSVPEVWVATGAYYACITLGSDIAIYGGFAGTESSLGERNITSNVTSIKSWSTGYPTIKMDTITTAVLDGFMIAGSAMNPAAGGGVYCKGLNASCLIANCSIANNSASSGGGIYFLTASPRIVNCAISGNSATNGGGIYISGGAPAFSNCRISGNTAPSGGGVYANASNANFINCIISGNQASQYGGGAFCNNSSAPYPSFINCTVSDNSAISSGGGILCQNYSSPAITNTIFARNTRQAIYEQSVNADPVVKNCLFNGNPDGDYCDENTASITGAAAINALPGNSGNVSGSPKFKMDGTLAITGTWTTAPAYDSSLKQTVLTDSRAPFASLSLAGRLIAPNLSSNSQALILSNTASQIMAQGDLSSWVYSGSSYVIADYHLEYPSAAIDAGTSAAAPAMDMEGNARPLDIPGMGIEGANAYDIGAYEASWSSLLPVNDSFSSASIIAGVASSTRGANRLGTKESGEPNHAGNAGGASVWWKWTAPETGAYIFDTHGSDFNTLFSIYTGASVSALTQVAANDDDGSANGNSGLIFTAQAGVQYRIAVDGFGGASGSIMLNWTERRTLTVASMSPNSGILMTVSPLDNNGDGSGMTQFSRFYYHGTTVTLTAPLGAPNGNLFYRWLIDGAEFAGNQSRTVQVLMNTTRTMTAIYHSDRPTLTVASQNPDNGVNIFLYPADTTGKTRGTTQFDCQYVWRSLPTLTAPPSLPNGWLFSKWLKDGANFPSNTYRDVLCSMDTDHTMMAVFAHPYNTSLLMVASTNPDSGAFVSVYPADKFNRTTGTTQFVCSYVPNSMVTLTARGTAPNGYVFTKWLRDGADFANNTYRDVLCSMATDHTMTAVYAHPYNTALLTVASSSPASGAFVSVYPADKYSQTTGTTQFVCSYVPNSMITLTARGTAPNGYVFWKWLRDGADFPNNTYRDVLCSMGSDHTMTAVYRRPANTALLTVASSNPDSGAVVSIYPADIYNQTTGTTQFVASYRPNSMITLTARGTAPNGNVFWKWLRDGADFPNNTYRDVLCSMGNDHTMTAVYKP